MTHTTSHKLFFRAQQVSPGGVHSPVRSFRSVGREPFYVVRGKGAYLFDADGRDYVDYVCSWGPLVLGHAPNVVVGAIERQAKLGTSYGACSIPELEMAEFITHHIPSIDMVRFVSSGTEATMSALRLARAFTERSKIVKFIGCYHGHADPLLVEAGSGALTLGIPGSAGVLADTARDTLSAHYNNIASVEALFQEYPEEIAAVIVEPVVGNCGLIAPENGFLQALRELCTKYKALLIFDEVMTGFRVHPGGAQALYGVEPDLTTLGKVIGGGLPVGAYGGRQEIMSLIAPLGPVYQAGTLSGNPLAMVAGLTTLKEWLKPGVFEETSECASQLMSEMSRLAKESGIPLFTNSVGTMFGFFFNEKPVHDYATAMESDRERFKRFFALCLARGVYFAPSPFEAGFISHAHRGPALEKTLEVLAEVFPLLANEEE